MRMHPVKKVSYAISTAREGKALDYDKLIMEVETNIFSTLQALRRKL